MQRAGEEQALRGTRGKERVACLAGGREQQGAVRNQADGCSRPRHGAQGCPAISPMLATGTADSCPQTAGKQPIWQGALVLMVGRKSSSSVAGRRAPPAPVPAVWFGSWEARRER